MRGSLSVCVGGGFTGRYVTSKTTGLRFRKTAPGGHHSASCTISVPRNTFRDLGPADKLYIYDSRTAATIWEGYTENPGATNGPAGQRYELSAAGGMVLAQDMASQVAFIDRSLDDSLWIRTDNATPGGTDTTTEGRLQFQFPGGAPIGAQSRVVKAYQGFMRSGQRLASCIYTVQAGYTDGAGNLTLQSRPGLDGVGGTVAASNVFNTTAVPNIEIKAGTHFAVGQNTLDLRILYSGGAFNVASDVFWGAFSGVTLRPILSDAKGVDVLSGYLTYSLYAHEVVNHLLGKMLPMVDGATAQVATGTHQITQLTYYDGATPGKILDDLSLYEPDNYWGVGATNTAGKHEFWYRAWPTSPRYEISTKDGYNAPGGEVDLCNRIVVYYTDAATGTRQSVTVTQSVPELGTRVRDADSVTLPDGRGDSTVATLVGQTVLAGKTADVPRAATAVVRRPIVDHLRGCMVMPWEIEPGYLVRVRETGEDLRMTEMEYTDADCSATLTLGTPVLSEEQILARVG